MPSPTATPMASARILPPLCARMSKPRSARRWPICLMPPRFRGLVELDYREGGIHATLHLRASTATVMGTMEAASIADHIVPLRRGPGVVLRDLAFVWLRP